MIHVRPIDLIRAYASAERQADAVVEAAERARARPTIWINLEAAFRALDPSGWRTFSPSTGGVVVSVFYRVHSFDPFWLEDRRYHFTPMAAP